MKDKHFDDKIKKALEHLEEGYAYGSWEEFEKKLNASQFQPEQEADASLDALIHQKLNDVHVSSHHTDWEKMSARLDEEFPPAPLLYRYKIMEAAFILLLIFTLFQILPDSFSNKNSALNNGLTDTKSIENTLVEADAFSSFVLTQNVISDQPAETSENTTTLPAEKILPATPPIRNTHSGEKVVALLLGPENKMTLPHNEYHIEYIPALSTNPPLRLLPSVPLSPLPGKSDFLLDVTSHRGTSKSEENQENAVPGVPLVCITKIGKSNSVRIGMGMNTDINYVYTHAGLGEDEIFGRFSFGYGSNLSIGVEFGKWELETGLSYQAKRFRQLPKTDVNGRIFINPSFSIASSDDTELNIMSLPFNLKYKAFNKSGWSIFVLTGVTFNGITQANNDEISQQVNVSGFSGGGFTPPSQRRRIHRGIFEGGGLKHNLYLALNLGVGVEKQFTSRWSMFVQPVSQFHALSPGVGLNKDKVNAVSLQIGARVTVK